MLLILASLMSIDNRTWFFGSSLGRLGSHKTDTTAQANPTTTHSHTIMTWTLLHDACESQHSNEIVQLATEHPECALCVDDNGATPLHLVCWGNPDPNAVEALLKACPQAANERDFQGNTALHIASSGPLTQKHVIQLLLDACPTAARTANREGLLPVHMACRYAPSNEAVIGLLTEANPDALFAHIKMGSPAPKGNKRLSGKETDHVLIDPSGGMATKDSVALRYEGFGQQIRDGSLPIHMAIQAKAPLGTLELLIKYGRDTLAETNKFGETPLHLALYNANHKTAHETVSLLLKCFPQAVHVRDKKGNLPIHVAATHGCSVKVAKDLLEVWPESIHETDATGLTPTELALQSGKFDDHVLRLFEITDYNSD